MRERWLSRRAVSLHVAALVFVPGCFVAAWWQITRASDGNGLSYLYSVEWPIFAILGGYFWWLLIHTDYDEVGLRGMRKQQISAAADGDVMTTPAPGAPSAAISGLEPEEPTGQPDEDDPALAAYNARLAELQAQGPKTWRSPERTVVRRQVTS